jgi:hypothetical protein
MRFALILGGLNPMLWLFATPDNYWFVYIEAFFSGIMWSGAGIVATNFVLAIAPNGKQQIYSGVFGALSGIAMMITMLLSGAFMPKGFGLFGLELEPEQVLFGLTGLARLSTEIPLTWIAEPRSRSVGEALIFIRNFARIKIEEIVGLVIRREK